MCKEYRYKFFLVDRVGGVIIFLEEKVILVVIGCNTINKFRLILCDVMVTFFCVCPTCWIGNEKKDGFCECFCKL